MSTYPLTTSASRMTRTQCAPSTAAPTPAASSTLHLTRRGRRVLAALIALPLTTVLGMAVLNGGSATATDERSSAAFTYVQVEGGESLWTLAQSIAPSADPRDVISDIVRLNQLDTPVVQPGQQLAIPVKYGR